MNIATPRCDGARFQKPLLLYASPREDGNTKQLLDQILPRLPLDAQPELVSAFHLNVRPCTDCRACYQEDCPLNGDGMGGLLQKIQEADLILCASPVYFNGIPAPMKAIVDRSQQLFVKRYISHSMELSQLKPGILMTTAGSDDENATAGVHEVFRMFFSCLGVNLIGHIAFTGMDRHPKKQIPEGAVERLLASLQASVL